MANKISKVTVETDAFTAVGTGKCTIQATLKGEYWIILTDDNSQPSASNANYIKFGIGEGLDPSVAVPAGRYSWVKYVSTGFGSGPAVMVHDESDL